MKRFVCLAVAVIVGIALIPGVTLGAAPFYEGKTIRVFNCDNDLEFALAMGTGLDINIECTLE